MKTSFISLSNREAADFVQTNPQLKSLVAEAAYLDGNLKEAASQAKEERRTGLGLFHSALELNHELASSNDKDVLENVLKLMHNSGLRIVEFFEALIQSDPYKEKDKYDEDAELVIKKDVFEEAVYYSIKNKNNQTITVKSLINDSEDQLYDDYRIHYEDSINSYTKIDENGSTQSRYSDEELRFEAEPNRDSFSLISQGDHVYDYEDNAAETDHVTLSNIANKLKAESAAEEEIPLQRLDLHSETSYVKNLYQALKEKF